VKEYVGRYKSGHDKISNFDDDRLDAYIIYEGLIKNNSDHEEKLEAMLVKVYNEKNIFISEGYTSMEISLGPGKSIPFKVKTFIDASYDTHIRKYFNESISFKPDIYPWFIACK